MSPIRSLAQLLDTASRKAAQERLWVPCCTMRLYLRAAATICFASKMIVRARLLHVHVLARLAGPDGHQGVPVIGRGDRDRVDGLVLEQLAVVGVGLGRFLRPVLDVLGAGFQDLLVDIADGDQFDALLPGDLLDVVLAAPPQADRGYADRVVGAGDYGLGCGCQGRAAHDKVSSVHRVLPLLAVTVSHSEGFRPETPKCCRSRYPSTACALPAWPMRCAA